MKNIFKRSYVRCLVGACLLLSAGSLFADDVKPFVDGGKISYTGATATYVGNELVLTYLYSETPSTLKIDSGLKAEVEILAVGGGGAGGTIKANTALGGGGGGAGGLILLEDDEKVALSAGDYTIKIGAGGAVATENTASTPGGNGGDTTISTASTALYTAKGGGGGGAESNGQDGGSGGGGGAKNYAAGLAIDNACGKNGGKGTNQTGGAGGGGAGSDGANAVLVGGAGGVGVPTDIAGEAGAEEYYAGGGGGGRVNSNNVRGAGGSNIGGTGGDGTNNGGNGVANTGSGGGGGGKNTFGGAGANGIVIIRILQAYESSVTFPTTRTFTWDGDEHVGVDSSIAYTCVSGTTTATKPGTYTCTLKPADGFTWRDTNDRSERTLTWQILSVEVERPRVPDANKTSVYDGKEHTAGIAGSDAWSLTSGSTNATHVASYTFVVTLNNPEGETRYVWKIDAGEEESVKTAPFSDVWSITKASNEITSLSINSYRAGATPSTPQGAARFGTIIYTYAADETASEWSVFAPKTAGTWYVKATVAETDDYAGATQTLAFTIWDDPANVFKDHVEISVAGYTGAALTDFPVLVRLSETSFSGLMYARAGDGSNLAFIMGDKMLDYVVETWDPAGESLVWVKVPTLEANAAFEMWWCLKDGETTSGPNAEGVWSAYTKETALAAVPAVQEVTFLSHGLVYRNGLKVNVWKTNPNVTPRFFDLSTGTPTFTVSMGALAEGDVKVRYVSALRPDEDLATLDGLTTAGTYYAIFEMADTTGYEPFETKVEVRTYNHAPRTAIGGNNGDTGRVLLMNRDTNASCPIGRQGYYDTGSSLATYWQHLNTTAPDIQIYNLQSGTESVLWKKGQSERLWHLKDCRHGNMFPAGDDETLSPAKNYLPWSSETAYSFKSYSTPVKNVGRAGAGWVVMQNRLNAAIYSKYFEDGIGTVYFDAVNDRIEPVGAVTSNYTLRVEYATVTTLGDAATDENCGDAGNEDSTEWYSNVAWKPVESLVIYKKDGTDDFVEERLSTNIVVLAVANGGTDQNFYRIAVPFNRRTGVRFRIVRDTIETERTPSDDDCVIILDNLIVSYPTMGADLVPTGFYDVEDKTKHGALLLGQELATTVPFPGVGETAAYARAALKAYTNGLDAAADPATFVTSAQMHYRWRYLSQEVDEWKTLDLDPMNDFISTRPMELPARQGDVEFFFESTLAAPYYAYVDYTGLDLGVPYSEESSTRTNALNEAGQPTGGHDWFFRLRRGASAWEGVNVIVSGGTGLDGTYPMELVSDDMWRALIPISSASNGVASVQFAGVSQTASGAKDVSGTEILFGPSVSATNTIPANGVAVEKGAKVFFEIDHNANYYDFKFSTKYMTWSVSRAEYQNFNHWHDAVAPLDTFKSTYPVNGVDDVSMITSTMDASAWDEYTNANSAWNEPFYLANSDDPGYPKDVAYSSHLTPNQWTAHNFTFVSTRLTSQDDHSKATDASGSGIAAKLEGMGEGSLEFLKQNAPSGLDKVTVSARLGQKHALDTFSWAAKTLWNTNYTFFAPATMSQRTAQDGGTLGEMAVGAAVSVIGYYYPGAGCYEFRVERVYSNKPIQLALYKWSADGSAKRLCSMDWSGRWLWQNVNGSGEIQNTFFNLFMSLENLEDGSTRIICGRSDGKTPNETASDIATLYGDGTVDHIGLYYIDKENPLKRGAYGVAARDCPAEFVNMFHYDKPLFNDQITDKRTPTYSAGDGYYFDNKKLNYPNEGEAKFVFDRGHDLENYWITIPGHSEYYSYPKKVHWSGLRVPTTLTQTLDLYLCPKDGNAFTKFGTQTVTGYAFQNLTFNLCTTGSWNMKLVTGANNLDVVIGNVEQTQWQAPDYEKISSASQSFAYTQGIVADAEVTLQPARGVASRPMSVRSPLVTGLGKVSFSYKDVYEGAEVWVQMATNAVRYNLTGVGGYNDSISSVNLDDVVVGDATEPVGTWITLKKYSTAELRSDYGQTKTYYVGLHNVTNSPITGVFRLFVPTGVVARAGIAATNATRNVNYGKITITGMTVSDEPALSDTSWYGFNLRAIGDRTDSEKRMFLMDTTLLGETGAGLDLGLNNSLLGVEAEDLERARANYPAIISPTMKNMDANTKSGVGSVTFKARLYSTTGATTEKGGEVVLYGASHSVNGRWDVLQTNRITSTTFEDFSWESKGKAYKAIKLEVVTPAAKSATIAADLDRIILDEVIVGERIQPSVSFEYIRPFRDNLMSTEPIADILSPNEQPLAGESWGIQTKIKLHQFSDEIDPESLKVTFAYYTSRSPWGYENWKAAGSVEIPLTRATGTDELIFRSVGENAESLVEPVAEPGSIVQFQVFVTYTDRDGVAFDPVKLESPDDWTPPEWYYPIDLNTRYGYSASTPDRFSAWTILDSVSPGRAWINEVNFNDGTPAENGDKIQRDNQFIEVCVPSGVDMTGWFLRLTDINQKSWVMARFGDGERLPSSSTRNETNNFAFVLAGSPETESAGGALDADGNRVQVDGAWYSDGPNGTAESGYLSYSHPFQFELVRPSGAVEHQFVLGGTNVYASKSYGARYNATNFFATLNEASPSSMRFLAGDDLARLDDAVRRASAGVITGDVENAELNPGKAATWSSKLVLTPASLNRTQTGVSQTIPEDWFVTSNGTNAWVTIKVLGSHILQQLGNITNATYKFVLPQGATTNVTYSADPWYEVQSIVVDGETKHEHVAQGSSSFVYTIAPTGRTCTVVATEGADARLDAYLDRDNEYTPSVLEWLAETGADKDVDDLRLAVAKEIGGGETETKLDLVQMYWLDIPAFAANEAEAAADPIWYFRYGIVDPLAKQVIRTRTSATSTIAFTNVQVKVQLYLTNVVSNAAYAPKHLQGLNYTKSDETTERWTSESMQIMVALLNGQDLNQGFLPFRFFTFDAGSFTSATDAEPFTSTIEIVDPFSTESPGYSYGFYRWPNSTPVAFKLSISTNAVPGTIERLKADSTYDRGF